MAKVCPYASCCENQSAHQLLGCAHFAHFAICPGTLHIISIKCNTVSSNFIMNNIGGSVFGLSDIAFRLAQPYGGLLVYGKDT